MFVAAYPNGPDKISAAEDITYVHAANALAAFEAREWRFDNSPFDQYLRGNRMAISTQARIGMNVFYGKGGCSDCHNGVFQTDQGFHAIAMPQIGPGKGDNPDGHGDFGREQAVLPSRPDLDLLDFIVMDDWERLDAIAAANELGPVRLKEKDIQALMAFLHSLTDLDALDMRDDVPASVPSGLPIWD